MYHNILLPVLFDDGHDTQASFLAAKKLANEDASFTVLHVMEAIPPSVSSQLPPQLLEEAHDGMERKLAEAAQAIPGADTVLVTGHAGRSIVDYAQRHDTDCIIVASHKPGLSNYFLGSTADRVVRHAPCTVHVIR